MGLARDLRRGAGFSWLVIVMLALGVGSTTALFTVVNGVLLRPLSFHDPGQLVLVGERVPQEPGSEKFLWFDTPSAFLAWRREANDFSALSAIQSSSFTMMQADRPLLLHGAKVSTNLFELLGVHAQLGRLLEPPDETDASRPMVITDGLWRSVFGAAPSVIGRHVGVPGGAAGSSAIVVGVLPPDFHLEGSELGPMLVGQRTDYFFPLHFQSGQLTEDPFTDFNYTVMGRLRAGVTMPQALAQLNVIQANLARGSSEKLALYGDLILVRDYAVGKSRQELWLLMAGVLAVLLIVCVNLGGLWLTRLADRRRDWAIRLALGAAPGRLTREVLAESAALGALGGGLGVLCAAVSLRALLAAAPADLPRLSEVHLDWRVFGFGLLLSLAAGLLTGLVPALRLNTADPQAYLKAGGAGTTADRSSLRSREGLIAVQTALATLLLFAAGLVGFSFYRLLTAPAGFAADRALAANIVFSPYDNHQRDQVLRQLTGAAAGLPGVTTVGFTSHLPLQGETWIDLAAVPGHVYPPGQTPAVNVRFISPGYLNAIGIPLLAGRDIAERDRPPGWPPKNQAEEAAMPSVVLLSRAAARTLWPDLPPAAVVGRQIKYNGEIMRTVIGVAEDAHDGLLTSAPPSVVYRPYWENPPYQVSLVVRTTVSAAALAAPLRSAIWRLAPSAPVPTLHPLSELRSAAVAPQRYRFTLLLLFAAVALLLAAMGINALVAHSVTRRRKEMAIRLALGARATDIRGLVLRRALAPVAAGLAVGLGLALPEGRLLANFLYQVSPSSPLVLAVVAMTVLAAALFGCAVPARRAARADVFAVLRSE